MIHRSARLPHSVSAVPVSAEFWRLCRFQVFKRQVKLASIDLALDGLKDLSHR